MLKTRCIAAIAGLMILTWPAAFTSAQTQPTPARDKLLAEVAAFNLPSLGMSKASEKRFQSAAQKLDTKSRQRLTAAIQELIDLDSADPELPKLALMRWEILANAPDDEKIVVGREVYMTQSGGMNPGLAGTARLRTLIQNIQSFEKEPKSAEGMYWEFTKNSLEQLATENSGNPRIGELWKRALDLMTDGPDKDEFQKKFFELYSNSIPGKQLLAEASIEKPFSMSFTDALSKQPVSIEAMKGTIVVIHFWSPATDAGRDGLESLQKLSETYKEHAAFIGVPVGTDLQTLKAYCEKSGMRWPQNLEPAASAETFAASQGITLDEVPVTYVINTDGTLRTTRALGRLDKLLPRLVKAASNASGER